MRKEDVGRGLEPRVMALGTDGIGGREKIADSLFSKHIMIDAERINLIGTTLADLSERTAELRGYL